MTYDTPGFNIAAIRTLVTQAFTPETLHRFCQDRATFRPILDEFGPGYSLNDMVDRAITYCQAHLLWDEFLAEVQKENPRQYARFEPSLRLPSPPPLEPGLPVSPTPQPFPVDWRQRARRLWPWLTGALVVILILVLGIWWLLAHGFGPVPEPTGTAAIAMQVSPSVTSAQLTETPVPTRTPTLSVTLTLTPLPDPYEDIWRKLGGTGGPLGIPAGDSVSRRRYTVQEFEHGLTFWRDNRWVADNWIYAVYWGPGGDKMAGASWVRYVNTWQAGDPAISCVEAAPEPVGPTGGFGRVWCNHPEVRMGLGPAIQQEQTDRGGWLDFTHGAMLHDPINSRVLVLFEDGHWRAFSDLY